MNDVQNDDVVGFELCIQGPLQQDVWHEERRGRVLVVVCRQPSIRRGGGCVVTILCLFFGLCSNTFGK